MTEELVKSYQVPPTELVVEVSSGEWVTPVTPHANSDHSPS